MVGIVGFLIAILLVPFRSKARLQAENAALRHQVIVLHRKSRGRVRLTNADRWFFVQLYRLFPSIAQALHLFLSEIRSGRNDGAIRRGPAAEECCPPLGRISSAVSPWPVIGAFGCCCSIARTSAQYAADDARQL